MPSGRAALALLVLLSAVLLSAPTARAQPRLSPAAGWLETLNWYRAASGLPTVTENTSWNAGIAAHLRYLKLTPPSYRTGEYANAHTENPRSPYYTPEGDAAGRSSNLTFYSDSERGAVDDWMAAPFHAIGLLRPHLQSVGFARDPSTSYAGLDVLRGLTGSSPRSTPVVFPGPDSATHLTAFGGESPNPLETCGYPSAGLPLIALLPEVPSPGTTAELVDDKNVSHEVCVVTEHNYVSSDPVYGSTGRAILQGDHAVLVIPRRPLASGRYSARLRQPSRSDVAWWFYVTGLAGSPVPAGGVVRVHVSDVPGATVLGNLTVTEPEAAGFTTAYPCAEGRPLASNNNYGPGQTIPNFAVVRADSAGDICVFSMARTHLIWDQVGRTTAFATSNANRLFDSRTD